MEIAPGAESVAKNTRGVTVDLAPSQREKGFPPVRQELLHACCGTVSAEFSRVHFQVQQACARLHAGEIREPAYSLLLLAGGNQTEASPGGLVDGWSR